LAIEEIASLVGWLTGSLGAILVACAALEAIELIELVAWRRTIDRPAPRRGTSRPFVSFHVPICSEPPEVVAATLLALSKLDYDAFEVLVIDNNTKDERLWQPVERQCRELGSRFRFTHLPTWPGFKAGALNYALGQTAPEATLISVIDADYEIDPNYLADIVGLFEDETVAFVQTPQDYRNWALGPFFRMCHCEYWQVFAVSMVLRNRRNSILMHGTMNLVRRDEVVRSGGWAEWCLTEDSELGLRILAAGHHGVYVSKTYGRGLLPFSYRDYKRQRRRWVIGGAQQLRRHLGLFLPWTNGGGGLTLMQKLHYLQGWLPWFRDGVIVASVPLSVALGAAALCGLARPDVLTGPAVGMIAILLQLAVRQVVVFRAYLSLPWRDTLGAFVAGSSLTWAVGCGWLAGLTGREQVFQRTPKRLQNVIGVAGSVRAELAVGLLTLLLGLAIVFKLGSTGGWTATALFAYAALLLPAIWMARLSARAAADAANQD